MYIYIYIYIYMYIYTHKKLAFINDEKNNVVLRKYCYMLDFLGSVTSAPCRVTMG